MVFIHPLHVAYHNTHIQRSFFFPEIKRLFLCEENSRNEYTLDTGPLLPGEVGQTSVPCTTYVAVLGLRSNSLCHIKGK